MTQSKNITLDIRKAEVKSCVEKLDNIIRAEYNTTSNFLEYYAGKENLTKVCNIKNQVIYGRRGTGKTHLLRALQEKLITEEGEAYFPIFIDLRKFKPLLNNDSSLYYALILFKELIFELLKCIFENTHFLYKSDEPDIKTNQAVSVIDTVQNCLNKFNAVLNGNSLQKLGEIEFSQSEVKRLASSFNLSLQTNLSGSVEKSSEEQSSSTSVAVKYISFPDMAEVINALFSNLPIERIFILIDEWSEIPIEIQPLFAELLKRAFISSKVTFKIAAIPNRTRLMIDQTIGLEDGGDVFGYSLDNRYIYEMNQEATRSFFNELLFNQLSLTNRTAFQHFLMYRKENLFIISLTNFLPIRH